MPHSQRVESIGLNATAPIRRIDTRFLSVTLDYACLLGAPWWEGTRRTAHSFGEVPATPVDLKSDLLLRYARLLSPAYLRLGGSEADRIRYAMCDATRSSAAGPLGATEAAPAPEPPPDADFRSVLTRERWDEVCRFASQSGLELFVTVNAGPGPRRRDGSWNPDNARELIEHAVEHEQPVSVWELGNEVNGFPFIHGLSRRVSARQYAADFARFHEMVRQTAPHARTAGPGSAVWPVVGEVFPLIPGFVKHAERAPDIITWHYYPQQSSRGVVATRRADPLRVLRPRRLNEARRWARRVARHTRGLDAAASPAATEIWLGETGHALYGGEPGVSDRFAAGVWWMDQLGLLARAGVRVVARQSLIGGDYGLLDSHSINPRPDFWSSLLWKSLMGEEVYAAETTAGRKLRVYAHAARHPAGGITMLLINLDRSTAARVRVDARTLGFDPHHLEEYAVTAPTPLSAALRINGEEPALPGQPGVPPAGPRIRDPQNELTIPPLSYAFVVAVRSARWFSHSSV